MRVIAIAMLIGVAMGIMMMGSCIDGSVDAAVFGHPLIHCNATDYRKDKLHHVWCREEAPIDRFWQGLPGHQFAYDLGFRLSWDGIDRHPEYKP